MAPASDTGLSVMKLEARILPGSAIGWQRHWPFKRMKHGQLGSEEQKENAAEASEAPSVSGASGGLADWDRVPGWKQGALGPLLFLNEHALNKSTSLLPWTLSQRDISPSLCSTTTWVSAGKRGMGKKGNKDKSRPKRELCFEHECKVFKWEK